MDAASGVIYLGDAVTGEVSRLNVKSNETSPEFVAEVSYSHSLNQIKTLWTQPTRESVFVEFLQRRLQLHDSSETPRARLVHAKK